MKEWTFFLIVVEKEGVTPTSLFYFIIYIVSWTVLPKLFNNQMKEVSCVFCVSVLSLNSFR